MTRNKRERGRAERQSHRGPQLRRCALADSWSPPAGSGQGWLVGFPFAGWQLGGAGTPAAAALCAQSILQEEDEVEVVSAALAGAGAAAQPTIAGWPQHTHTSMHPTQSLTLLAALKIA